MQGLGGEEHQAALDPITHFGVADRGVGEGGVQGEEGEKKRNWPPCMRGGTL